jgi:hypothetical protein
MSDALRALLPDYIIVPLHGYQPRRDTFRDLAHDSGGHQNTNSGSGASPTHRYARSGSFTVSLVMFSGTESAFPGQGAGPIVTHTVTVS